MKTWTTFPAKTLLGLLAIAVLLAGEFDTNQRKKAITGVVGSLLDLPPGTLLSEAPDNRPDQATTGSPVLVLSVGRAGRKSWFRVLAADGTSGWTHVGSPDPVPVRVAVSGSVSDISPDNPSAAEPKELSGELRVTGASDKSAAASLNQMMLPADRNWYVTPWLRLSAASGFGWSAPSEVEFRWAKTLQARGMVRPPFTAQYAGLSSLQPRQGDRVLRVDEAGENAEPGIVSRGESWPRVHAIFFADTKPQAILFANDSTRVLRLSVNGQGEFLVFHQYLPELDRVECRGAADANRVCVAQVTAPNGDGYVSGLWMVDVSAQGTVRARYIQLEAGSGEPSEHVAANWWWDANNGILGIVSAGKQGNNSILYYYSGERGFATEGKTAVGVFLPSRPTYREARAESITVTKNTLDVFPILESHRLQWAPGHLFASRVEAEAWQKKVRFGLDMRVVVFKRPE
jgi:uncharacterized protein YaiE (UPF0345 family)